MEFLGHIGIDPKIILAQIVNFLVLVLVLRSVLYKPLLAIFKKRKEATEKLEKDIAEIEKKKTEAEAAYRAKLLDGEGRANEIITQARKSVDSFTDTSLDKNREYLDQLLRETKARIEGAKSELVRLNQSTVADAAFTLSTKFLSEKLRRELHNQLVNDALAKFEDIGSNESDIAFKGVVSLHSADALPTAVKNRLKRYTQKKFGKKLDIEFAVEPGLKAGLVIRWGGYELNGSLRGALAAQIKN